MRKTRVNGRGFALVSAALPQPPTLERHDVTEVLSQLAAMRAQLDSLEHGQRQGFAKIAAMIRSRYPDDHEISVAVDRFIAEACR